MQEPLVTRNNRGGIFMPGKPLYLHTRMAVVQELVETLSVNNGQVPRGWGINVANKHHLSEGFVSKLKTKVLAYMDRADSEQAQGITFGLKGNLDQESILSQ